MLLKYKQDPWNIPTKRDPLHPWIRPTELPPPIPDAVLGALMEDVTNFLYHTIPPFHEDSEGAEKSFQEPRAFIRTKTRALIAIPGIAELWETHLVDGLPRMCSEVAMGKSLRILSELIEELHLNFEVGEDDVLDFMTFSSKYSPTPEAGDPKYLSGREMMERWQITPAQLGDKCLMRLSVFLWNKEIGGFESIDEFIPDGHDIKLRSHENPDCNALYHRWEKPNIWFLVPQWWYFRKSDVSLFEILEKLPLGDISDAEILEWLTHDELIERWKINPYKLQTLVLSGELSSYCYEPKKGISKIFENGTFLHWCVHYRSLTTWIFNRMEVDKFRQDHRELFPANPYDEYRSDSRRLVAAWVRREPYLTKHEVIKRLKNTRFFNLSDETLWRYVKDLLPKQSAGRPRKK